MSDPRPVGPDDRPVPETLLDEAAIRECVERLAAEIAADHPDGVVLVGVLKGALIFLADLARAVRDVDVEIGFIAISRYAPDSGRVRILHDVDVELTGRDVILVEDLVDTGLTLGYLVEHVARSGPASGGGLRAARPPGPPDPAPDRAVRRARDPRCLRPRLRACTGPTCTGTSPGWSSPTGSWCGRDPTPTSLRSTARATEGRRKAGGKAGEARC